MPRVAIGPMDASGTSAALAAGLRELGVDVELVVSYEHPFGYAADRVLGRAARARYALRLAGRRDVLHLQFGRSWVPALADARLARARGRTVVVSLHGDDCRLYGLARALFPAQATYAGNENDAAVRRQLERLARVCHAAIVKDLELAAYVYPLFERVYVAPLPVLPDSEPAGEGERPEPPVVLHAPSDPRTKGTVLVQAAVDALRARRPLELRLVSGVPHEQVRRELRRATVLVDQVNAVAVGVLALEAMQAGLPVLAEIDERALAPYQADVPLVRLTPESLEEELELLLDDPERRRELAAAGRAYVERTHAPARAASAALAVYEHARSGAPGLYEATADGIRLLDSMAAVERDARRSGQPARPLSHAGDRTP